MENVLRIVIGLGFLVLGYFLGVKQKISLLHSYHYKRVMEEDKPIVCKWSGIGVTIVGVGILLMPLLGETVGSIVALLGLVPSLGVIIKYNHGLF